MNEVAQFISTVGFPIFVSSYLLIRFEPTIKANTKAIYYLANRVGEDDPTK